MDLSLIGNEVIAVAKRAGSFINGERSSFDIKKVEQKGLHDFVSYVDKGAEGMIVEELSQLLPEAGFIAEEGSGERNEAGFNWVIDPLDGTTNFIHGLPPFSVSIALMKDEAISLGVVYEITRDECFYSWEGAPAYLNEKEIAVSCVHTMEDGLIATGFPYTSFTRIEPYLESLEYVMRHSHGVRRLGSAAVDLAYVACGRFDAFYEYGLNPWDVAAGTFLVRQAGGKVGDFKGGKDYIFGEEIVAANKHVFGDVVSLLGRVMGGR